MKATFDPAFKAHLAGAAEPSRYCRARGKDPVATLLALAMVAGLLAAFVYAHPAFQKAEKRVPTVVTLLELPDDPPPEQPEPDPVAPPPVAQVVTPPPLVMLPERPVLQIAAPVAAPPAPERVVPPAPPPAPRGPEIVGEISAKVISARPIEVPLESRRNHEEGTVVLSVLLGTDGRVSDISVAKSSGFPRLDRAVLSAVRDWRWSPLMRDGTPVMVRGMVTIPIVRQGGGRRGGHDRRVRNRDEAERDEPQTT